MDAYEGLLNRPLRTAGDTDGLLNDAKGLEGLARRVIQSCDAFLAGHKKDKRASRSSAVKTEATSEQAALRLRTAEVKRGVKPTWASWKDAVQSTSETTTRDIAAEKGFGVGGDKGAMNDVTKVSFKTRIGERGKPTADAFFKADKNSVATWKVHTPRASVCRVEPTSSTTDQRRTMTRTTSSTVVGPASHSEQ